MCIRGLGAFTKTGSVLLTAATSGGAVVPAIMSPVSESRGFQYGLSVVIAFFAFGALLPIYTETVPAAKAQVDPVRADHGMSTTSARPHTQNRASRVFSAVMRRKNESSDLSGTTQIEGWQR